jgi:hypothetical protein
VGDYVAQMNKSHILSVIVDRIQRKHKKRGGATLLWPLFSKNEFALILPLLDLYYDSSREGEKFNIDGALKAAFEHMHGLLKEDAKEVPCYWNVLLHLAFRDGRMPLP